VGVATVLKQFHSSHTHSFLALLGQYVRANLASAPPTQSGCVRCVLFTNVFMLLLLQAARQLVCLPKLPLSCVSWKSSAGTNNYLLLAS